PYGRPPVLDPYLATVVVAVPAGPPLADPQLAAAFVGADRRPPATGADRLLGRVPRGGFVAGLGLVRPPATAPPPGRPRPRPTHRRSGRRPTRRCAGHRPPPRFRSPLLVRLVHRFAHQLVVPLQPLVRARAAAVPLPQLLVGPRLLERLRCPAPRYDRGPGRTEPVVHHRMFVHIGGTGDLYGLGVAVNATGGRRPADRGPDLLPLDPGTATDARPGGDPAPA